MSEPEPQEFPDWVGKIMGLLALLIVLMAVLAAASFLIPRILGI